MRNELYMPLVLMERGKWMQVEEKHCSQHWRCERVLGNQEPFFIPHVVAGGEHTRTFMRAAPCQAEEAELSFINRRMPSEF